VVSFLIISVLAITAGVQIQMKIMRAWAQKHKKQIENSTTDNGKDATQPAGGPVQEIVADSHTAESAPVAEQSASEIQIDCKVDVLVVESDSCIANTQCQLEGNAPANASALADTKIVSTAQIDLQVQGNAGAAESMPSTAIDQVGASCASPKRPSQMGINAGEIQSARQKLLMFSTGLIGGYLSSLSGTGGPLILFPLWTLLDPRISMKTLVSYSTPFAFTLVCFSFVGALLFGDVEMGVAMVSWVVSVSFVLFGGCMMERLGESSLKLSIGLILVMVGCAVAIRTLVDILQ
jgi:hypothetical protein